MEAEPIKHVHKPEKKGPDVATFIKAIGDSAAFNFYEAVAYTGKPDILTSANILKFLNGIGSEKAESVLLALSSAKTLEQMQKDPQLSSKLTNFIKHSSPGEAWAFFRATESTGKEYELSSDRVLRFAKEIGHERAEQYFKIIEETQAVGQLASNAVANHASADVLKSACPESAASFFTVAARQGMPEIMSSPEMQEFAHKAKEHLTGELFKALESSRLPRETAIYYMKMSKEAGGIGAMRECGIEYDSEFIREASASICKGSYEPDRYIAIKAGYSASSVREELGRMLSIKGYAVEKVNHMLSDSGISRIDLLSMKEKFILLSTGPAYIKECADQINKFLIARKDPGTESYEFVRKNGFNSGIVMRENVIAQVEGRNGKQICAYTSRNKANALEISSKQTSCCAFLPEGGSKWSVLGYANDPAVVLLCFKSEAKGSKGIFEGSPDGIAICSLALVGAEKALYVNSVEGGKSFSKAIAGKEKTIAYIIDDYAKAINAEAAVFNNAYKNSLPQRFSDELNSASHCQIPMSEVKLLARKDSRMEKGTMGKKLIR